MQKSVPLDHVLMSVYTQVISRNTIDVEQKQSMLAKELRKVLYVLLCSRSEKASSHAPTNSTKRSPLLSLNVFHVLDQKFPDKTQLSFKQILECHALACLAIGAKKRMDNNIKQVFAQRAINFLRHATRVTTHVQAELRIVCDFLLKTQIEFGQGAVTLLILPLYNALRKSQTRTSCLTSLHTSLLQACLIAKAYNIALRVLATPFVEVQPKITNFNIEDYVLFYYYSARVYIGAKQYKNAKRALLECIATPAADEAKSAVAIEAYKYLILVCLLLEGKMPNRDSLPRYVNRRVVETAETLCSEYVTFGKAYERKLSEVGKKGLLDLETLVKENEKLFAKDKTRGLVGQCMNAFVRHRIANQTMTYVTLSLEDLANAAGCVSKQEAETVLLDMISQGEISARVDQSTEVVAFLDEELSESSASGGLMQKIATQTTKMLLIAKSLRDKNESLTANEKYVSKFLPKKKLGTSKRREMLEMETTKEGH